MADKLTRDERLVQALRDNLRRRKAQARAADELAAGDQDSERANAPTR